VKVTGQFRQTPTVKFSDPLKATSTERTVIKRGSGRVVTSGETVDIGLAVYDGTTGKEVSTSGFGSQSDQTLPMPVTDETLPGLVSAIKCLPVGSRAVTTAPVKSAWGSGDPTQLGLKKTDSVVFVVDIVDILPNRATGTPQKPQAGFPKVTLSSTGKPTVTIPKGQTPPTTTQIEVLKKGHGATVKTGDTVTVQYQGVIWRTGKVFDQSWGGSVASFSTTDVVKGFSDALVGHTVGSQVVAIVPPADGYGPSGGVSQVGIKATDTLVFVVDILKTQTPSS
jgi:peptidylprolyl isomerase